MSGTEQQITIKRKRTKKQQAQQVEHIEHIEQAQQVEHIEHIEQAQQVEAQVAEPIVVAHIEAPHVEAPHIEAPHVEAPHVEAPHVEAPHVEAQIDSETDVKTPKKRGRKPKGGKIITTTFLPDTCKTHEPNIIVHLKCGETDLTQNTFIAPNVTSASNSEG